MTWQIRALQCWLIRSHSVIPFCPHPHAARGGGGVFFFFFFFFFWLFFFVLLGGDGGVFFFFVFFFFWWVFFYFFFFLLGVEGGWGWVFFAPASSAFLPSLRSSAVRRAAWLFRPPISLKQNGG